MPVLSCHEFRIFVGVDCDDLGMLGKARHATMNGQFAESPAEFFVTNMIKILITQKDDLMLHQRVVQLIDDLVRQRLGKVDTFNLRTYPRCHRLYRQDFVIHRLALH